MKLYFHSCLLFSNDLAKLSENNLKKTQKTLAKTNNTHIFAPAKVMIEEINLLTCKARFGSSAGRAIHF